jgi:hypothetical protein
MTDPSEGLSRRDFVQGALSGAVGLDGAVASFVEFLYAMG